MQLEKGQTFVITTKEEVIHHQTILANYDFSAGKRLIMISNSADAKLTIRLAQFVRKRQKCMNYEVVEYQGQKDQFKIELKYSKK